MPRVSQDLFESDVWTPAFEKFAGVTHLTVSLYHADEHLVCGPINRTTLFDLLTESEFGRRLVGDCLKRCLRRTEQRVLLMQRFGLGVVGTPLVLDGEVVGAAVAGYHLFEFAQSITVERLAREAALPIARVWDVLRTEKPVSNDRFVAEGELLQAFGDTLLKETYRTHQYAEVSAKLRAADAAKDQFLAMVSHELRGPLNAMLGWARMLRTEQLKESAREHALETIERNARMQARLIEDLLNISRILAGSLQIERQPVMMQPVIEAAIQNVTPSAEAKQIRVAVDIGDVPRSVDGDPNYLQQVVSNLLTNAVKFTPTGGEVAVRLTPRGANAELVVSDTGEGIKPEFLPHIFEPFRQQDASSTRVHGGLGLGLTIAHHLIALHGGTIRAESAGPGRGATFTVRLPLLTEAAFGMWSEDQAPATESSVIDSKPILTHILVLVVEDDVDARDLLRTALEGAGADVTAVGSAADALEVLDQKRPDVLVSDIGLPGEDGYSLIRKVRRRKPRKGGDIPAIAVTAWASIADRDRAAEAGFQVHIAKPVDASRLVRAIASLAGRA